MLDIRIGKHTISNIPEKYNKVLEAIRARGIEAYIVESMDYTIYAKCCPSDIEDLVEGFKVKYKKR